MMESNYRKTIYDSHPLYLMDMGNFVRVRLEDDSDKYGDRECATTDLSGTEAIDLWLVLDKWIRNQVETSTTFRQVLLQHKVVE